MIWTFEFLGLKSNGRFVFSGLREGFSLGKGEMTRIFSFDKVMRELFGMCNILGKVLMVILFVWGDRLSVKRVCDIIYGYHGYIYPILWV